MYCPVCDSQDTTQSFDKITLSNVGLDNVYLDNVPVISCNDCDHISHIIPKQKLILRQLTTALCTLKRSLKGAEFAFLRNELNYTGIKLAMLLGTTNVTISRWEKGEFDIHPLADRSLRALVLRHLNTSIALDLVMENISVGEQSVICIDVSTFSDGDEVALKIA
ncbi:MAG: YgiT-type zinc finger domain-containing protein [Phenylobacterium sp.]|jgi:YgiT-type zinc finger domain-containing protein